jgi:hypothetical protein
MRKGAGGGGEAPGDLTALVGGLCRGEAFKAKAVGGRWDVLRADGKAVAEDADGWMTLERGVSHVATAKDTEYRQHGLLCFKHDCDLGGFDANVGLLSAEGWSAVWEKEAEMRGTVGGEDWLDSVEQLKTLRG